MHSTTSEAIQVAKGMRANCLIVTHFSQRFSRNSPDLGDLDGELRKTPEVGSYPNYIMPANDLMRLKVKDSWQWDILKRGLWELTRHEVVIEEGEGEEVT